MKKLYTFLIALFLLNNGINAQWVSLKNVPTFRTLYSVFPVSSSNLVVVGAWDVVIRSADGGSTWNMQTIGLGSSSELYSVYFVGDKVGYAVGLHSEILKTTNGGATWAEINSNFSMGDLSSVYFTDELNGYVTTEGHIFKTTDGGANWSDYKLELVGIGFTPNLSNIFFTDSNTGYACSDSLFFKTTDGGTKWTKQTTGIKGFYIYSIYFINSTTGFAVGGNSYDSKSMILKTTDGGKSWTSQIGAASGCLSSVYFVDANIGYAVGGTSYDSGFLLKTTDGGNNWITQKTASAYLNSIRFLDANIGYAVGGDIVLKTTNGGTAWINETQLPESTYNIYPNPAIDKITITTNETIIEESTLRIFNINGEEIMNDKLQLHNKTKMDVSTLAKGIYFVKIQTKSGIVSKKLVIQ